DFRRGRWEFKLPWGQLPVGPCEQFVLDSDPPTLLVGCLAVFVMPKPGSNTIVAIEDSEVFGSGAGNAGLAAWSEMSGMPVVSRIRTWTMEQGAGVLVESMP